MRTGTGIKQLRQCQRRGHVGRVVDGTVGVGASVYISVCRDTVSFGSMVNTVGGYLSNIPSPPPPLVSCNKYEGHDQWRLL